MAGAPKGIIIGNILNNLMGLVIDVAISNDRDILLGKVILLISLECTWNENVEGVE